MLTNRQVNPGNLPIKGGAVDTIQEALMKWGEAIQVTMENRSMFYSPVLKHWRVKKWAGKDARRFLYDGEDFSTALDFLLGPHTGSRQE